MGVEVVVEGVEVVGEGGEVVVEGGEVVVEVVVEEEAINNITLFV